MDWCLADERELVYGRRRVPILQDIRPFRWWYLSLICAWRVHVHRWQGQVVIYSKLYSKIAKVAANSWHSFSVFWIGGFVVKWAAFILGSFTKFRYIFSTRVIPDELIGFPNSLLSIYVNAFAHMILTGATFTVNFCFGEWWTYW